MVLSRAAPSRCGNRGGGWGGACLWVVSRGGGPRGGGQPGGVRALSPPGGWSRSPFWGWALGNLDDPLSFITDRRRGNANRRYPIGVRVRPVRGQPFRP